MEFGKAFTYIFEDKEWLSKIIIGAVITFLGFLILPIPLLYGYMLQTVQNVARGQAKSLPEWEDIGSLFGKGLKLIAAFLVYALPLILLSCIATVLLAAGDRRGAGQVAVLGGLLLWCIVLLYALFIAFLAPGITVRVALTDSIGAAFQLGEIFGLITKNLGNYILVIILTAVAGFLAWFGIILCFVGYFATGFWATLVTAHLYGQLARSAYPQAIA